MGGGSGRVCSGVEKFPGAGARGPVNRSLSRRLVGWRVGWGGVVGHWGFITAPVGRVAIWAISSSALCSLRVCHSCSGSRLTRDMLVTCLGGVLGLGLGWGWGWASWRRGRPLAAGRRSTIALMSPGWFAAGLGPLGFLMGLTTPPASRMGAVAVCALWRVSCGQHAHVFRVRSPTLYTFSRPVAGSTPMAELLAPITLGDGIFRGEQRESDTNA